MTKNRKSRARRKPSTPALVGDHGTGTAAALAGTELKPLVDEKGSNPNNVGRRRRKEAIDDIPMLMRQTQAAKRVRDAYCKNEMLSSGSPLKEKVQASPKPDATVAAQIEAQASLEFVMSAVPGDARFVVEQVCWYNRSLRSLGKDRHMHGANFKVAMDLVANKCRF